jgi:hypothetical protein
VEELAEKQRNKERKANFNTQKLASKIYKGD